MRLRATRWFGIVQWKVLGGPDGTRVFGSEQEALDYISEILNRDHAKVLGEMAYDRMFLAYCGIAS